MYPKELRVNFDAPVVNAFDTYGDLKKRFPNISLGRRQFRTTKAFCENSDLSTDIYHQETPGREVINNPILYLLLNSLDLILIFLKIKKIISAGNRPTWIDNPS